MTDIRDDYQHLVGEGAVVRHFADRADADAWRAGLRDRARADRMRIRTGTSAQDPDLAWAALIDRPSPSDDETRDAAERLQRYLDRECADE